MSLSPSTTDNARQNTMQELRELPLDVIVPDPSQPRRHFGEEALMGLAGSMGEHGVLQPVLVRPLQDGMYQLVAGERRWRAAKLADLQSIPALVSRYDDAAALEVALIENLARKDLNPVEQARAFATLSNEFGLTHRQIGKRVGRHETVVSSYVRLLRLSEEILELLERGTLSEGHGRALLRAKDPQARSQLARAAVQEGWTVQRIEARASASNVDLLASQQDRSEQVQDPNDQAQDRSEQAQDLAALSLARSWGDLLGAEVHVRPMSRRQLRMEVEFDFASEGLALADRLVAAISR
jgi:ParB family transcriptional regulator, chromosome partitioning protein